MFQRSPSNHAASLGTTALLSSPTPYEYALLSAVSYYDAEHPPTDRDALNWQAILSKKGWECVRSIADEAGYCGSLWVHETTKQLVIAHRGSQNLDSWITDAESIAQLKPGHFVEQAIRLLKDPQVNDYKKRGYRLSVTGHSLGGFLAQVSVYWAQRSEFAETYYPNMSAVIFDSPGALDFLKILQPNLEREQGRVILKNLNIHNFCAMPTVVSTYGKHIGSIWHLPGAEGITFDFVNAHKLEPLLAGFDPTTGQPRQFRLMRDWPEADYSAYMGFDRLIKQVATEAIKAPFSCINFLYRQMREKVLGYQPQATRYERLVLNEEGQVSTYLRETQDDRFPMLSDFNQQLTLAIHGHYVPLSEEISMKHINIHHFDMCTRVFLQELHDYRPWPEDFIKSLSAQYGEKKALLEIYSIICDGVVPEVCLDTSNPYTVFSFQTAVQQLLHEKGIFMLKPWLAEKAEKIQQRISRLEEQLEDEADGSSFSMSMNAKIQELKTQLETINKKLVEQETRALTLTVSAIEEGVHISDAEVEVDVIAFDFNRDGPEGKEDRAFAVETITGRDIILSAVGKKVVIENKAKVKASSTLFKFGPPAGTSNSGSVPKLN